MKNYVFVLLFVCMMAGTMQMMFTQPVHATVSVDWNSGTVNLGGSSTDGEGKLKGMAWQIYDIVSWILLLVAAVLAMWLMLKVAFGNRDALKQFLWAMAAAVTIGAMKWVIPWLFELGQNAN